MVIYSIPYTIIITKKEWDVKAICNIENLYIGIRVETFFSLSYAYWVNIVWNLNRFIIIIWAKHISSRKLNSIWWE